MRILLAVIDDVTGWATGALWRLALLAVISFPIWVFFL